MSNINEYQAWTTTVWTPERWEDEMPGHTGRVIHCLMGLQTETAELTDVYKKCLFTPSRPVDVTREHRVEEIGDVLYYLVRYAEEEGIAMDEVIKHNVKKLEERYG